MNKRLIVIVFYTHLPTLLLYWIDDCVFFRDFIIYIFTFSVALHTNYEVEKILTSVCERT